jgi:CRISPR-associated protein Cas2
MRRCLLITYDIRDPKRLRRIHRIMKSYGEAWQYSVFFCNLKPIDVVRLRVALEAEANLKEDQILFCDLGSDEDSARKKMEVLGQGMPEPMQTVLVL